MVALTMFLAIKRAFVTGIFMAAAFFSLPAYADMTSVVGATFSELSVSAPTPSSVAVCHGFGCKYRAELGLTAADQATLARLMAPGKASAAAERKAIGAAGAWFDR